MPRKVPTFGLFIALLIVFLAVYVTTKVESLMWKFIILFAAVFFIASAFMGLVYENRIASQIIKAGYIDQYISSHGVGTQKTFKKFVQQLRKEGYKINPGVEKILWEEIKKKTGYYQNSV
ncbi:MAG: hypothetical protein HXS48_09450 [Theionarchaea archaeon]|nr:hypothetical protein [Theionarchaea archaeon]